MSATATTPPRLRNGRARWSPPRHGGRAFEPGRPTLDDRITAVWTRLVDAGKAECPVCGDELHAGRACGGCGSELS